MAGKTGFLYVFDRVTGAPIWPIEERPVPRSEVPGEQSWPTQPYPTKPPPFSRQSFTADDINPHPIVTNEARDALRQRMTDRATWACSLLSASSTPSICRVPTAAHCSVTQPRRRPARCMSSDKTILAS